MQVETKMRYHLTAVWVAINRNVGQFVQKRKPLCIVGGKCKLLWNTVWKFLKNSKNRTTTWSSISTPDYTLKKKKKLFQKVICRILWVVQCLSLGAATADWIWVQLPVREGPHAVWYRGKKVACTPMLKVAFLKSITQDTDTNSQQMNW